MAAANGGRTLEETPTWAVAVVCFVLIGISIAIEHIIHLVGKWLKKRNKSALYEALEKIKAELMLLGFISLLLTVGQQHIAGLCVSKAIGATWHPCNKKQESKYLNQVNYSSYNGRRKLLTLEDSGESHRRVLATAGDDKCAKKGQVAFVSTFGIHQLHIFIFVLALSHVLYCITIMALGQIKMRKWKSWEKETRTTEYLFSHDPERFRFTRDTSFGRRHLKFWSHTTILLWITCFFRQFIRSISKVDYFTLRHGFIVAHLAPQSQSNFDFQKYIQRSLEEDFKVVVGINPATWLFAVIFLLFNTHGLFSYLWLPFIPLIIILLVGTKLQVIITKMGLRIQDRGEVIKGSPVVQPGDELFWFNRPRLLLHLIHFVLFQNAFQLAFFAWAWYEFGLKSCFHENVEDIVIRLTMGVLVQILCSYATLPLYALVTQMGSTMKPTIFNERVAKALRNWHHTAKKHLKESRQSGSVTPLPSRPSTPLHGTSPISLLRHYRSEIDDAHTTPRISNFDNEFSEAEGSVSPSHRHQSSNHVPAAEQEREGQELSSMHSAPQDVCAQHEVSIRSARFSFDTGPKI